MSTKKFSCSQLFTLISQHKRVTFTLGAIPRATFWQHKLIGQYRNEAVVIESYGVILTGFYCNLSTQGMLESSNLALYTQSCTSATSFLMCGFVFLVYNLSFSYVKYVFLILCPSQIHHIWNFCWNLIIFLIVWRPDGWTFMRLHNYTLPC